MSRWFRWYEGTSEDGKFRTVARNAKVTVATVMGVWAILLEDAAHPEHRGVATRGEDFWGAVLGLDDNELVSILSAMEGMELISVGHGAITITKWKERQFETDTTDPTNADRQRRWREKHKQDADQTQRNATITEGKRPDTEADTEKKDIVRPKAKSRVEEVTDHFETWYAAYPLHKGRGAALRAYKAAILKTEIDVLLFAAKAFAKQMHGREKNFIPHAATWLNQERWLDDDLQPPKPQEPVSNGKVWVEYGTDPGDAWQARYRSLGKVPPGGAMGGYWFDSEWPPENVSLKQSEEAA